MQVKFIGCRRVVVSMLAVLSLGVLQAATYDYKGTAAYYTGAKPNDLFNPDNWSSAAEPVSGNTYQIADRTRSQYCGASTNATFAGNLKISNPWGCLLLWGTKTLSFAEGLTLAGGDISLMNYGSTCTIGGPVTVTNTSDDYSNIRGMVNAQVTAVFTGSFHGGSTALFNVRQESRSDDLSFVAKFNGDMSDYLGTMQIAGSSKTRAKVVIGDTTFGGTIYARTASVLAPGAAGTDLGNFAVAKLKFGEGATLAVAVSASTNGSVTVTDKLTLPTTGTVKINVSAYTASLSSYRKVALLIAPSGSGMTRAKFDLALPSGFTTVMKAVGTSLVVEDDGANETLFLVVRKVVSQCTTDGNGESAFLPAYAAHWTGLAKGDALDSEAVYLSPNWNYNLRTPNGLSTIETFGGHALVIGESANDRQGQFYVFDSACVDNLHVMPCCFLFHATGVMRTLSGKLHLIDPSSSGSSVWVRGRDGATLTIASEIDGSANLDFSTQQNYYGYGNPTFVLSGTNTAYSGKILVTNQKATGFATTLVVADGRSLGGAMASATYNGVELRRHSVLKITAATSFDETTRGWHILGSATVNTAADAVEAKVLAPLTMSGTLVKAGSGTLALGGACRFTESVSETPLVGTNVLTVASGWIKPLAAHAFDGLAISFAAGTGIALSLPSAASEEVANDGLVNCKWTTPFDLTACGGKLSVRLDGAGTLERNDAITVAVCTVPSAAAAALRGKIAFAHVPHHSVAITERVNADGSVSFLADIDPTGLAVIIR